MVEQTYALRFEPGEWVTHNKWRQLSVLSVISIISSQFRLVHQTFKFRALSQHLEEAKMTSRFMYWTSRILSTGRTDTLQARIIMVVN